MYAQQTWDIQRSSLQVRRYFVYRQCISHTMTQHHLRTRGDISLHTSKARTANVKIISAYAEVFLHADPWFYHRNGSSPRTRRYFRCTWANCTRSIHHLRERGGTSLSIEFSMIIVFNRLRARGGISCLNELNRHSPLYHLRTRGGISYDFLPVVQFIIIISAYAEVFRKMNWPRISIISAYAEVFPMHMGKLYKKHTSSPHTQRYFSTSFS